jgi:uncharacterized protein (DUF58 family)
MMTAMTDHPSKPDGRAERLAHVLAEAQALASGFREPDIAAPPSAHPVSGGAGRRRAGTGEAFWQYRRYQQEDGAERIDWRRSSRSDRLYVRDTELETARSFAFWIDRNPGFHWTSGPELPTKLERGLVLMSAAAGILGRAGERCRALGTGRASVTGQAALARIAQDLARLPNAPPPPSRQSATVLLASDFYLPVEHWRNRIKALGRGARAGVLLRVTDPAEADFSYSGRVRFEAPGATASVLFGRAETVRTVYQRRYQEHTEALRQIANALGWPIVEVWTDAPASNGLASLMAATRALGQAHSKRFTMGRS